ncbi:glycine-rich domain-containing protein [Enterobacter roggenkampii]|uniref:glycine-rich domain-containing protein n=1 Tax=Enterobacter roggenkampii TaxID=1812935 RepID=UPI002074B8FE|nr:hypothetical protein [Enterobacter roggenkampii]MCM7636306.1 hypothetical protein [Enterobacter roggenkampii]
MALQLLAANNAQSVLAAGISASATSLTLNTGTGALFPSPVSGASFFKLTLIDAATGQISEIVHVTAKSGDVLTIVRGQEGTSARAWSANDIAANMLTAGTILLLAQLESPTFTGTPAAPTAPAGTNTTQIATTAFATALPGRFLLRRFVTSSSTYTPGADVKMIRVRVIGGGGGGGAAGVTNSGYTAIGGGGGAGGYSEKTISITSGFSPVSITIGSGGIPGGQSGYSGGAGGVTSFGSYCSASGGDGGAGTAATNNASYIMSGGAGGIGSNGEVNAYGQSGAAAIMPPVNGGISGAGGTSIMSSGPGGRVGNASGNDGVYGSGASGGISQVAASTQYGGRGGTGIVIIEEFS